MPSVTIMDYEAHDDLLPPLCLKCGDPATVHKDKRFAWYPRWVPFLIFVPYGGLLVVIIVGLMLTKRMSMRAPLCDKHRNIWRNLTLVILGAFAASVGAAIAITVVGIKLGENVRGWRDSSVAVICGGWALALLVWLIVVILLTLRSVRPTLITDREMTLAGVSERFVDALESERDEAAAKDRRRRNRQRRAIDEIGDDLPPPPSRPADDRIRE